MRSAYKPVMLGGAILAEPDMRRPETWQFNLATLRLREIERVIMSRHGDVLPETDDALLYLEAVAQAGAGQDLIDWAARWAPWALQRRDDRLVPRPEYELMIASAKAMASTKMMSADSCARMLAVTLSERTALGLRTIGAADATKQERRAIARETKLDRDRARAEQKRRMAGAIDRTSYEIASAESRKPWIAMGMSRATWYRMGKAMRETGASQLSILSTNTISDGLVSSIVLTPRPDTATSTPQGSGGRGGPVAPRILAEHAGAAEDAA